MTILAKENLDRIEKGLRLREKFVDSKLDGFDIQCVDTNGKTTLIMMKTGVFHETTFGNLISKMADIREVVGKEFRIILLGYDFTPAFVKAASQIPTLKLKKLSVKTDIKTSDVA